MSDIKKILADNDADVSIFKYCAYGLCIILAIAYLALEYFFPACT